MPGLLNNETNSAAIDFFSHLFTITSDGNKGDLKTKAIIYITQLETLLGCMFACATEEGICLLEFTDRGKLEPEFRAVAKLLNAVIMPGCNNHLELLNTELNEYFQGARKTFTLPLVTPGTAFQQLVWNELLKIPYGNTRTYKQQAIAIKNLPAIRAVANANGINRIPIIIPCHRVVGTNGKLTGYGSGLWRKRWLLDLEAKNTSSSGKAATLFPL